MVSRQELINNFLNAQKWSVISRETIAEDASFRRYERIINKKGSVVLMDAPPEKENVHAFEVVTKILKAYGLSVPEILERDVSNGLLLLEDFGDHTYSKILDFDPDKGRSLYCLAVDVLIHLHKVSMESELMVMLPNYSTELLLQEANIFLDWYLPQFSETVVSKTMKEHYNKLWEELLKESSFADGVMVLRDYHVDNLMLLPKRKGISACGLLDFQDAVIGSGVYDLVSLLQDARRAIDSELVIEMKERYFEAFKKKNDLKFGSRDQFDLTFSVLGANRHAKVLGIFTRLAVRDEKPGYVAHIPHVWKLLDQSLTHPRLNGLRSWFDDVIPKNVRLISKNIVS